MPLQSPIATKLSFQVLGGVAILGLILLPYQFGQLGVIALAGLLASIIFVVVHPLVPFTLYFGALFFSDTTFGILPISLNQVLAPLFFLSALLYKIKGHTLPVQFALLPLLGLVVTYFVARGLTAADIDNGLIYSRYAIIYLLMAVSLAVCMSTERTILTLAWIIVSLTAVAAAGGIYEAFENNLLGSFTGNWGSGFRIKGTAPNSIVYAWNLLYAFPFAFLLFSEMKSRFTRVFALLSGVMILGAATLTFNRQSYVLMVVMIGLCSILYAYKNRAAFLGLLTVFGGIAAFTVLPLIIKRMLTVTSLGKDYSFLERRDSYLMGVEMLKKHPIFGVGFGSYSKVWGDYIPKDYSTYFVQYRGRTVAKFVDMGFMSIAAETGIIGLLLFIAIIVTILVRTERYRRKAVAAGDHFARNLSSTVLVTLFFITATSMIQDTFLYTRVWIFYGVAMLIDERVLPIRSARITSDESPELPPDVRLPVTP